MPGALRNPRRRDVPRTKRPPGRPSPLLAGGGSEEVWSSPGYNDGNRLMVVAEIGSSGLWLWVDGTEVSYASVTPAQTYTGY